VTICHIFVIILKRTSCVYMKLTSCTLHCQAYSFIVNVYGLLVTNILQESQRGLNLCYNNKLLEKVSLTHFLCYSPSSHPSMSFLSNTVWRPLERQTKLSSVLPGHFATRLIICVCVRIADSLDVCSVKSIWPVQIE